MWYPDLCILFWFGISEIQKPYFSDKKKPLLWNKMYQIWQKIQRHFSIHTHTVSLHFWIWPAFLWISFTQGKSLHITFLDFYRFFSIAMSVFFTAEKFYFTAVHLIFLPKSGKKQSLLRKLTKYCHKWKYFVNFLTSDCFLPLFRKIEWKAEKKHLQEIGLDIVITSHFSYLLV